MACNDIRIKYKNVLFIFFIICYHIILTKTVYISSSPSEIFSTGLDELSEEHEKISLAHTNLKKKTKEDFLKAGNLAEFIGINQISGIHMPVPVNIVFLGFNGNGRGKINISPNEIQSWMEHLDHVIPHTRVPISELSCKEDGHCSSVHGSTTKLEILTSYVHMNVSVHVLDVDVEVSTMFERALNSFSRPITPNQLTEKTMYQVDMGSMEAMINGFLNTLGLSWSNTIIISNLKNKPHDSDYAYRLGLSRQELDNLISDKHLLTSLENILGRRAAYLKEIPGEYMRNNRWRLGRPKGKFEVNKVMHESSEWVRKIDDYFTDRERFMNEFKIKINQIKSDKSVTAELLLIKDEYGRPIFPNLLGELTKENGILRSEMKSFSDMRILEPEEGCLTDIWIGSKKWIYIDLTALKVVWGPYTGGEGVKSDPSLPKIDEIFDTNPSSDIIEETKNKRLEEMLNDDLNKKMDEAATRNTYRGEVIGEVDTQSMIEAELDIYEDFAEDYCLRVKNPPEICSKIKQKVSNLLGQLESIKSKPGVKYNIKEHYPWEIFGMIESEEANEGEMNENTRRKDIFLAHISAVVSKAIRHVFVPPSLTWDHYNTDLESSIPFTIDVTFRLNLINDPTLETNLFDTEKYRREVLNLKLRQQRFRFTTKRINIVDDRFISMALASSLKSTVLQTSEEYRGPREERLYFDSDELSRFLETSVNERDRHLNIHANNTYLDIPVFILSLDRYIPIFIDKYYTAKALPTMILIVHNVHSRGLNPMGISCNRHMVGNTISSSMKSALAATMQYIGGILPPQLGFSPSHHAINHDWMWNIGANPFSLTSPGIKFTETQIDALYRNYVLDAIDTSIEEVNLAILSLQEETLNDESWKSALEGWSKFYKTMATLSTLTEIWRRVIMDSGELNFDAVADGIKHIRETTDLFINYVFEIKQGFNPMACQSKTTSLFKLKWISDEAVGVLLLVFIALAIYKLWPRKKKSKNY